MANNVVLTSETAQYIKGSLESLLQAHGNEDVVMHKLRAAILNKIQNNGKAKKAGTGDDLNIIRSGVSYLLNPSRNRYNPKVSLLTSILSYLEELLKTRRDTERIAAFAFEITAAPKAKGGFNNVPEAFGGMTVPTTVVNFSLIQLVTSGALKTELETMPTPVRLSHVSQLIAATPIAIQAINVAPAVSAAEPIAVSPAPAEPQSEKKEDIPEKTALEKGIEILGGIAAFSPKYAPHRVLTLLQESKSPKEIVKVLLEDHYSNEASMQVCMVEWMIHKVFNVILKKRGFAIAEHAFSTQDRNILLSPKEVEANCELIMVNSKAATVKLKRQGEYAKLVGTPRVIMLLTHTRWFLTYVGMQALKAEAGAVTATATPVPVAEPEAIVQTTINNDVADREWWETVADHPQNSIEGMLNVEDVIQGWIQGSNASVTTVELPQISPSSSDEGLNGHLQAIGELFSQKDEEIRLQYEEIAQLTELLKASTLQQEENRKLQAQFMQSQIDLQSAQEALTFDQDEISLLQEQLAGLQKQLQEAQETIRAQQETIASKEGYISPKDAEPLYEAQRKIEALRRAQQDILG
jgi:hypothetical protein